MNVKPENQINCSGLNVEEINTEILSLIKKGHKHLLLKNPNKGDNLIEGLKEEIKIDVIGDVGNRFSNFIENTKLIVSGNTGNNSCCGIKSSKITINGSSESVFGGNAKNSQFFIFGNCGKDSFKSIENSKVVMGGLPGVNSFYSAKNSTVIILNLKGGQIFLDDTIKWFEQIETLNIYIRGGYKLFNDSYIVENISLKDEDIFLPLISEFSRLFNFSLDEIKSKGIYKLKVK